MEFNEQQAENELADERLELPDGELERFITGNPMVIWDILENCSIEKLPLAIERVWRACVENMKDGDNDFAEEIGNALVHGLTNRLLALRNSSPPDTKAG